MSLTDLDVRRVLAAVADCALRGNVLPHSRQPECGCAELTECRGGRGRDGAGGVTREECVKCRCEAMGVT